MGIILLPGLIFATYAQFKVNSTYNKYNSVLTNANITASEFVKKLVSIANMTTTVNPISGRLTDHFDPRTNEINLSNAVYNSTSVSALGIACHEFGHAMQQKEKYAPYQFRRIIIPITNFASQLLWPLVIIGLILNFGSNPNTLLGSIFMWSGIAFFGLAVLVNLATLPVEFNASRKAVSILRSSNLLSEEELDGTKEVLKAAALTYVAALIVSILNLLRFVLLILMQRKRD